MQSLTNLIKKHHRIIILCLVISLIICLLAPYKIFSSFSIIESMVGDKEYKEETKGEDKTGISIPLSFNVPDSLKMDEPQQTVTQSTESSSCPPCPPCARCPEPNFECKKVPKYRNLMINNHSDIPMPINPEYTTFAM